MDFKEKISKILGRKDPVPKQVDFKEVVRQDLLAAVSLLRLILDKEELFNGVVHELEQYRKRMIELEKQSKSNGHADPSMVG